MKRIILSHGSFALAALAALVVLAAFALAGYPIVPPDALAGLSLLPMAIGSTSLDEIADMVRKQGEDWQAAKDRNDARIKNVESAVGDFLKKAARPASGADDLDEPLALKSEGWINAKTAEPVLVLRHGQTLAKPQPTGDAPSVGRFLRGLCLGGTAPDAAALTEERKSLNIGTDPAGGYTVSGILADQWIDALRANMVLSKAGGLVLPMEAGQVSIARVTGDPACSWHGEGAAIAEADPTFGKLTLNAKTIVCLVKFSVELAQDSMNLEQQLSNVIVSAMANAIDSAGMNGVATNASAAPEGLFNLADRNSVTSIGAPTSWDFLVDGMYELALDNTPMENIGALIAHPAVWKKMRKLKTGITNDNTPLTMPAEVAALPKLWSTAAPLASGTTAKGIIANWSDLVMGMRQQITVKVLSESFLGSNLQLAVLAYARVDFGAARPGSFCTLEGITV